MGLDWNPIGKPKPGHEDEFERLFRMIGELPENVGWFERLRRKARGIDVEAIKARWFEIQESPLVTIQAPQVGRNEEATAWARDRHAEMEEPKPALEDFLREMDGYDVVALAPPSDGVPYYSNGAMGYVERYSFRAQFLKDCVEIIGEKTYDKCFNSCLAPGLAALGHELRAWATSYSQAQGVAHVENVWSAEGFAEDSAESKLHILFSAARWCEFWSSRGHGLEAYW